MSDSGQNLSGLCLRLLASMAGTLRPCHRKLLAVLGSTLHAVGTDRIPPEELLGWAELLSAWKSVPTQLMLLFSFF